MAPTPPWRSCARRRPLRAFGASIVAAGMRTTACLIVLFGTLLATGAPATAHDRFGRAQPRVDTIVKGSGSSRVVAFRVRDSDSGSPIPQVTLVAVAHDEAGRSLPGDVKRVQLELFRCSFTFPTPGRWSIAVRVGGIKVVPTSFSFDLDVQDGVGSATATGTNPGGGTSVGLVAGIVVPVALVGCFTALIVLRRRRLRA